MDKAPKFKYVPEVTSDVGSNCPIMIIEGKYEGIVYRYGKISLKETDNQEIDVTMEIDVLKSPKNFNQQDEEDEYSEPLNSEDDEYGEIKYSDDEDN